MAPFRTRTSLVHKYLGVPYELSVPYDGHSVWGFVEGKLAFVLDSGDMSKAKILMTRWIEELLSGRLRAFKHFPCLN